MCTGDITIADNMTFTMESGFDEDTPQFTLTCTSTGGPASTVTWTRDSETVSGGMTVLDDPVAAQYTHILTVTGRLGGQYQCTVSNNKPSQDSAQFTVAGIHACGNEMLLYIMYVFLVSSPPPNPPSGLSEQARQ